MACAKFAPRQKRAKYKVLKMSVLHQIKIIMVCLALSAKTTRLPRSSKDAAILLDNNCAKIAPLFSGRKKMERRKKNA